MTSLIEKTAMADWLFQLRFPGGGASMLVEPNLGDIAVGGGTPSGFVDRTRLVVVSSSFTSVKSTSGRLFTESAFFLFGGCNAVPASLRERTKRPVTSAEVAAS